MRSALAAAVLAISLTLAGAAFAEDAPPADPPPDPAMDYESPPALDETKSGNDLLTAAPDAGVASAPSGDVTFDGSSSNLPSSDGLEPKPLSVTPNQ